MGGRGDKILAALTRSGRGLPEKWAHLEEIHENWMDFYLDAFFELVTERPPGFGPTLIPWSKIRQYGRAVGLEGSALQTFHTIIRHLDEHVVKSNGNPTTVLPEDEATGPPDRGKFARSQS